MRKHKADGRKLIPGLLTAVCALGWSGAEDAGTFIVREGKPNAEIVIACFFVSVAYMCWAMRRHMPHKSPIREATAIKLRAVEGSASTRLVERPEILLHQHTPDHRAVFRAPSEL
ncbi:MAG: hypothetical protein QF437_13805, partial [Planctomycetota bacterium]|nr:hypothetical protein [Planctomycetota bacterium]